MRIRSTTMLLGFALSLPLAPALAAMSDEEIIKNATSAAPESVGKNATVIAFDEKMQMRTVREGTNGFTCIPDDPSTPGNDPMCLDANGLEWAGAWLGKTEPPAGKVGFGYMLMGGPAASNSDPFAKEPAGGKWVDTGPHVMIMNTKGILAGYKGGDSPDTTTPYLMWADTPYEHLMIPVQ